MGDLDRRLYTSHPAPTDSVSRLEPDRVKLARNSCMLPRAVQLSLSRYCTHQLHPCTVLTVAHHIHTRPPDEQARLAIRDPWCTLTAFLICADLIGFVNARVIQIVEISLSHAAGPTSTFLVLDAATETCLTRKILLSPPVVAPALVVVALPHARTTTAHDAIDAEVTLFRPTIPDGHAAQLSRTKTFLVTSTSSFLLLGIQFRWLLTHGTLACALVTTAELAIDDAKQAAWMEMYAHDRDTLEDILYRRLQDLWAPLTDSMQVFDAHVASQTLCAQKVWEALLTAFPLDHKHMQTALLA